MKTQNTAPQLRFPGFTGDWEVKTLGEVTSKTDKKNKNKEILPIYSINNKLGFIPQDSQFEGMDSIERGYDTSLYKIIESKTFAYNPARINVGSIAYNENIGKVIISSLYICFQTTDLINDKFLNIFFETNKFNKLVQSNGEGGVRIYLFYENFSRIPFSFPTLPEQEKIANFLTAVDEKLKALKKKKTLLEQYKKGIMQRIFSQELRFLDDNGKPFPAWETKKLGEVATITTGNSNRDESNLTGKYIFFDRSQDVRYSDRYLYEGEAVIVPGEGQTFAPKYYIGKFDLHQRTYSIMKFKNLLGKFCFHYISFNTKHLESFAVGSTVKSLRLPMFVSMPINIPSIPEQEKIAKFLGAIDDKIGIVQQEIVKLEEWKRGLLQRMFV